MQAPQWRRGFELKKELCPNRIESDCWKSEDIDSFEGQQDEYSNSFDAASTSQVRLKVSNLVGSMEEQREPVASRRKRSRNPDNPAAETWFYKGEPVAQNSKAWVLFCTRSQFQLTRKVKRVQKRHGDHYLEISPDTSHYMEAVLSMVRKI